MGFTFGRTHGEILIKEYFSGLKSGFDKNPLRHLSGLRERNIFDTGRSHSELFFFLSSCEGSDPY
jgi:hypothetical protein